MPQTHPPYPPEFRQQMVELVRAGRTPGDLAKEFEPSDQTIQNWVAQAVIGLLPTVQASYPTGVCKQPFPYKPPYQLSISTHWSYQNSQQKSQSR